MVDIHVAAGLDRDVFAYGVYIDYNIACPQLATCFNANRPVLGLDRLHIQVVGFIDEDVAR